MTVSVSHHIPLHISLSHSTNTSPALSIEVGEVVVEVNEVQEGRVDGVQSVQCTELYIQGVHSLAQSAAILHSASFLDWNFYQVSPKCFVKTPSYSHTPGLKQGSMSQHLKQLPFRPDLSLHPLLRLV